MFIIPIALLSFIVNYAFSLNTNIYKSLGAEYYEASSQPINPEVLTFLLNYMKPRVSVLEPMCGSGRYLIPLLERGIAIEGVDISWDMLEICKRKCRSKSLACTLYHDSLETMNLNKKYGVIFIPSGSFCLLTDHMTIKKALTNIYNHLAQDGVFIIEIETIFSRYRQPDIWYGSHIKKEDGSLLMLSTLSHFNTLNNIETLFFKYDLCRNNVVIKSEIEEHHCKLYEPHEFDVLLAGLNFRDVQRLMPYTTSIADEHAKVVVYVCKK